jgi:hypothetical protein
MEKEFSPEYMSALRRYHQNHPEHEAAAHRAVLGGLPPEVAAEIVRQGDPSVAYHSRVGQIGSMPKSQRAQVIAALRSQEQSRPSGDSGPTGDEETETERENRETSEYLGKRGARQPGHRRTRLVR